MRRSTCRRLLASAGAWALSAACALALPVDPVLRGSTPVEGPAPAATFNFGAGSLRIDQGARRVFIDWSGFNIAAGESVTFNQADAGFVAFNRVTSGALTTIDGALNATGGVWLFAPGGLLFGANARVNTGAFMAGAGILDDDQISPALNGQRLSLRANPAADAVAVAKGATLRAGAGGLVLQAESLIQDGLVTSEGSVGYLVSDGGALETQGGSVAIGAVAAGPAGNRLDHGGETRAGTYVEVAAQGAYGSGRRTVINLQGVVEAAGVRGDGRDSILVGGGSATPTRQGAGGGGVVLEAGAARLSAAGDVRIDVEQAALGQLTASGELSVRTYGALALDGVVTVDGSAELRTDAGDLTIAAPLTAGRRVVALSSGDLTVAADVGAQGAVTLEAERDLRAQGLAMIRSDSDGDGDGQLRLVAGRDVQLRDARLLAGAESAAPTADVEVRAGRFAQGDQPGAGGDLEVGLLSGRSVFLSATAAAGRGGRITLVDDMLAGQGVFVESAAASAADQTGGIRLLGDVTSAGDLLVFNFGGGEVEIGAGAVLRSDADDLDGGFAELAWLISYGDIRVGPGAQVIGPQGLIVDARGLLTVSAEAQLSAPGARYGGAAQGWPLAAPSGFGGGVRLAAADFDLLGSVSAGTPGLGRDIEIEVRSAGPAAVLGGADAPAGAFHLSNAEFQRLSGRAVRLQTGPDDGASAGVDLTVADLALDPSRLAELWLGAPDDRRLAVTGEVTSALGSTPVDLRLGFARGGLDGVEQSWIPGEISITGGLGAGGRLGRVGLLARGDILIGVAPFVDAARQDANFDAVRRSLGFAVEDGRVFIDAGQLQLAALGRVVQQNTSRNLGFAGVLADAPTQAAPMIFAPDLPGLTFDGAPAEYSAGPIRADLFGALRGGSGGLLTGGQAAAAPFITGAPPAPRPSIRFNACDTAGGGCAPPLGGAPLPGGTQTQQVIEEALALLTEVPLVTSENQSFVSLPTPDEEDDGDEDGIASPITGSGNEDLWTTPVEEPGP